MAVIGLVQAAGTLPDTLKVVEGYLREAKAQLCDAVCFPEAFLTGYSPRSVSQHAIPKDCDILQQISGLACSEGIDVLVGFMEQSNTGYYLTHGLFRQDGGCEYYRKTHLGQREREIFTAENELPVFSLTCGLTVGIQLCVETHFPEISQVLSLKGADVIFAPYAVPGTTEHRNKVWKKFIPARAYDNRVYFACCNLWDGHSFNGGCFVADPNGEIIAEAFQGRAGITCFEVDPEILAHYRSEDLLHYRYYPPLRRNELYDI